MIINQSNVDGLFRGFNVSFNKGLNETKSHWAKIAMKVSSSTSEENYSWLDEMPVIREWLGDRVIHDLSMSSYKLENRKFEDTITVKRTDIEDDQYGIYTPKMEMLGAQVARFPDKLVFKLLGEGSTTKCYDGQFFFDTDHPVGRDVVLSIPNYVVGAGPAWYLFDCSQPIRPLIFQERLPFEFVSMTDPEDDVVFTKDRFVYGVRGRSNVGFGLWQLAYASKQDLTAANYEAARAAMMSQVADNGEPLGVQPTHLVVPPALEGRARRLLKETTIEGANEWAASAELIVSPYLV